MPKKDFLRMAKLLSQFRELSSAEKETVRQRLSVDGFRLDDALLNDLRAILPSHTVPEIQAFVYYLISPLSDGDRQALCDFCFAAPLIKLSAKEWDTKLTQRFSMYEPADVNRAILSLFPIMAESWRDLAAVSKLVKAGATGWMTAISLPF
jgi:hypothetical protein